MQPYKLSGEGTWINCPWWIRTTITGSKDRCPAIGRRGSGKRKLVQKLDGDNARGRAGHDASRPRRDHEWRQAGLGFRGSRGDSGNLEYCGPGSTHPVKEAELRAST